MKLLRRGADKPVPASYARELNRAFENQWVRSADLDRIELTAAGTRVADNLAVLAAEGTK